MKNLVDHHRDEPSVPVGSVSIDPDRWDEENGCSLSLDGKPDTWLNAWNAAAETA